MSAFAKLHKTDSGSSDISKHVSDGIFFFFVEIHFPSINSQAAVLGKTFYVSP